MRTFDIVRRAGRSLRNAKARTILTSLAIAVGAFTITISLAAGEGVRQYANNLINSNVNPNALFITAEDSSFSNTASQSALRVYDPGVTSNDGFTIKQLTQADVDKLNNRNDLESVVPIYSPTVEYVTFGNNLTKFVGSVNTYDSTIINEASSGSLPKQGTSLKNGELVVPSGYVETLISEGIVKSENQLIGMNVVLSANQSTATPTSEEIQAAFMQGGNNAVRELLQPKVKNFNFTIKAVSKKSAEALAASDSIKISPADAKTITEFTTKGTPQYQKYFGVTAVTKNGYKPADVKQSLIDDGMYAQTANDLQAVVFTVVNTLQGIVIGFGIIALIASIFGIINTQYISVLERTREIGLMKALGMRGTSVSRLFQFEAAWIGFIGGVIGSIIAIVIGLLANPLINKALSLSEGTNLLIFQPVPIIVMILSLIAIAMLAGWFPARKAAKLDPIAALRTE